MCRIHGSSKVIESHGTTDRHWLDVKIRYGIKNICSGNVEHAHFV